MLLCEYDKSGANCELMGKCGYWLYLTTYKHQDNLFLKQIL